MTAAVQNSVHEPLVCLSHAHTLSGAPPTAGAPKGKVEVRPRNEPFVFSLCWAQLPSADRKSLTQSYRRTWRVSHAATFGKIAQANRRGETAVEATVAGHS